MCFAHCKLPKHRPEAINLETDRDYLPILRKTDALIEKHDGKHLTRVAAIKALEGSEKPPLSVVIFEFPADIPDLQSCSAFGETPEEALQEVLRAKQVWLEAAHASGKPIPEPRYRPVIYQAV